MKFFCGIRRPYIEISNKTASEHKYCVSLVIGCEPAALKLFHTYKSAIWYAKRRQKQLQKVEIYKDWRKK